jgi:putative two-component system hydrogenase maturation factor HypX/HoxX
LSLEYDINDATTRAAVALFQPDVILAPFLKRAVPADVWRNTKTLIVHPGPLGDRGPSALDHAVQAGRETWGVTVLEARAEMDSGPRLGAAALRHARAPKSSLYRREVTEAAVTAVRMALARVAEGLWPLIPVNMGAEDDETRDDAGDARGRLGRDGPAPSARPHPRRRRAAGGARHARWGTRSGCTTRIRAAPPNTARPGDIIGQANEAILRRTGMARSGSGISPSACRRGAA